MTRTISLDFRIDTKGMVARFWADLAIVAVRQLGMAGDAAAPALRAGLDEIGYFGQQHLPDCGDPDACKQFTVGWDSATSLFDGRFVRDNPLSRRGTVDE